MKPLGILKGSCTAIGAVVVVAAITTLAFNAAAKFELTA